MAETLGPYEIRGELGRGAMAVVWRGYDPRLEREVAIKEAIPPYGVAADVAAELVERFVREGRAAAQLNHHGIVIIHDADVYEGRPVIVMELIDGETLADVVRRGPLGPNAGIAIVGQLLDAVGYAHGHGVIHRDIKPDNIFITRDGRVKLADFGIAHVGAADGLTQAGTVMGTPGYMAPEQIQGAPVDLRADIFACGAVLYETLSGHNPFASDVDTAVTTVMYRIVHENPPELPASMLGTAPWLNRVAQTAMAKNPDARYQSAVAMQSALTGGAGDAQAVVGQTKGGPNWVVLVGVCALILFAALVLMAQMGPGGPRGVAGAPTVVATQTAAPAAAPVAVAAVPVTSEDGKFATVVKSGDVGSDGVTQLTFDYIEFLTGDTAQKEAASRGDTVDNDYYIVNDNRKLRTFEVNPATKAVVSSSSPQIKHAFAMDEFLTLLNGDVLNVGEDEYRASAEYGMFWVTIKNNQVVKLEDIWVP